MDVVTGLAIGVVTVVVLVTAAVIAGFVVLFRRRGDSGIRPTGATSLDALSKRAGSLLVRLDDALRDADDELGYAIAQFGPEKAREYGDALASARGKVAEAFRLKQALDDAYPDSDREKREWTLQVIALSEQAEKALAEQDAAFASLRRLEVNAAGTLADVRSRIAASTARLGSARDTLTGLATRYVPETFAQVAGNPDAAAALLATAASKADAAAPGISASGVSAVSGTLQEAGQAAHRADQLLDAVERTAADLAAADAALEQLRTRTKTDLVEAKAERDAAPDADTADAIIRAIAAIEAILAERPQPPTRPIAELDRLGDAVAALDAALASARNQAQRLEHARAAYVGTLVSAKSQIAEARNYIGARGGGVDARTRLAEAERQLMLAEAETDPVEALDTIRRAVTHARDADALARFDTMGSR
jgi:plasmid stabilization system protein ParE